MKYENAIQVFIADDQPHCLEAVQLALEDAPDIYIAGTARNGFELLHLLQEQTPHVVIMDIYMKAMDGIRATGLVKEFNENIKVIGFTQYTDEQLFIEMMQAGADGYLLKNADSQTMIKAVRTVMNDGNFFCSRTMGKLVKLFRQGIYRPSPEPIGPGFFTGKEKEVLLGVCEGLGAKQIAWKLSLTENTVNKYKANLRKKTNRLNDAMLVVFAIQHHLYIPES